MKTEQEITAAANLLMKDAMVFMELAKLHNADGTEGATAKRVGAMISCLHWVLDKDDDLATAFREVIDKSARRP